MVHRATTARLDHPVSLHALKDTTVRVLWAVLQAAHLASTLLRRRLRALRVQPGNIPPPLRHSARAAWPGPTLGAVRGAALPAPLDAFKEAVHHRAAPSAPRWA